MNVSCRITAFLVFALVSLPCLTTQAQTPATPPSAGTSQTAALDVKVRAENKGVPPGQAVRVHLEIKNRGQVPVTLSRVLVSDKPVDALSNKVIAPGKSVFWNGGGEVTLPQGKDFGMGTTNVLVESTAGVFGGRVDVERIEPFEVKAFIDARPIFGGAESATGDTRKFDVSIKSRIPGRQNVKVDIALPSGLTLAQGSLSETRQLRSAGDQKKIVYQVLVPVAAPVGEYPINITVTTPTRTYQSRLTVAVTR